MCKYKANLKIIPFFLSARINFNFILNVFGTPIFNANALVQIKAIYVSKIHTKNFDASSIVSMGSSNASTIVISAGTNTQSIVIVTIGNGNSSIIAIVFLTIRLKVVVAEPTLQAPSYNYRFPHHC